MSSKNSEGGEDTGGSSGGEDREMREILKEVWEEDGGAGEEGEGAEGSPAGVGESGGEEGEGGESGESGSFDQADAELFFFADIIDALSTVGRRIPYADLKELGFAPPPVEKSVPAAARLAKRAALWFDRLGGAAHAVVVGDDGVKYRVTLPPSFLKTIFTLKRTPEPGVGSEADEVDGGGGAGAPGGQPNQYPPKRVPGGVANPRRPAGAPQNPNQGSGFFIRVRPVGEPPASGGLSGFGFGEGAQPPAPEAAECTCGEGGEYPCVHMVATVLRAAAAAGIRIDPAYITSPSGALLNTEDAANARAVYILMCAAHFTATLALRHAAR
ncbi:hypothetical protein B9Q03_12460 [Candidatus Marsarchaeota G2 archaeon OSP_D]|uniref:SWIM-type domain-containing protein n=1 Tax=Candidatus Marsarchaeota G2 archaeon OSP_D TaxID=1978157 RepID=A0A2R6AFS3_9ARCH|nr:MAG: hypothetical protein B9Q03_12460 [Candidatus Marsarchaeota G2 archaeon OSP_D]